MRWSIEELLYGIKVASNRGFTLRDRILGLPRSLWRIAGVIIKWIFTGYCWATIWDLDHYFMEVFIKRLKMFKKLNVNSYPSDFDNKKEWDNIIDRLIHGFEVMGSEEYATSYIKDDIYPIFTKTTINGKIVNTLNLNSTPEQEEEMHAAWEKQKAYDDETMEIFTMYFRYLWD